MGRDALAGVEALLAALEERGVLPAADLDAIRDDAERRRRELHFRMFRGRRPRSGRGVAKGLISRSRTEDHTNRS